jgi:hypothetical protein
MKKKLILIVAFVCLTGQPNSNMCAENKQSWADWFRSKFSPRETALAKTAVASAGAALAGQAALSSWRYGIHPIDAGFAIGGIYGIVMQNIIQEILKNYPNRTDKVRAIKDNLIVAVNNPLLYPTRSSKINVLVKKDEFLAYVNDQDSLLQDACKELSSEINAIVYSDAQYAEDQKIDGYISQLKAKISSWPTVEGQIAALERMQDQQKTIAQMQGYLSLYFRLKNQLELEKQLTPEQKMVREKRWGGVRSAQMKQEELKRLEELQTEEMIKSKASSADVPVYTE